jgi:hypothetical protein
MINLFAAVAAVAVFLVAFLVSNRIKTGKYECNNGRHKFKEIEGVMLPYVYCARWRCDASAVSRWADPALAVQLHNAIPEDKRFPPVELHPNGTVKREIKT